MAMMTTDSFLKLGGETPRSRVVHVLEMLSLIHMNVRDDERVARELGDRDVAELFHRLAESTGDAITYIHEKRLVPSFGYNATKVLLNVENAIRSRGIKPEDKKGT